MVEFPTIGFPVDPQLYIETEKAQLDPEIRFPSLTVEREQGGYEMEFSPARLQIDNGPYFDSVGLECIETFAQESAAAARDVAWEAAAAACRDGTAVELGASLGDLAMRRLTAGIERMLACIQPARPEIACAKANLDVSYVKDAYNFEWDVGGATASYTPYSIEMWVEYQGKATLKGEST